MRVRVLINETSLRERTVDEVELTGDIFAAEDDVNGTKIECQCNITYNVTLAPMTKLLNGIQEKFLLHVSERTQENTKVACEFASYLLPTVVLALILTPFTAMFIEGIMNERKRSKIFNSTLLL